MNIENLSRAIELGHRISTAEEVIKQCDCIMSSEPSEYPRYVQIGSHCMLISHNASIRDFAEYNKSCWEAELLAAQEELLTL